MINGHTALRLGASLLALWLAREAGGQTIHVAPDGDEAAAGTVEAPLASLERALERLREARAATPATAETSPSPVEPMIVLHEGDYFLSEATHLTGLDSGTMDSPLIITSAPGERARLLGAIRLSPAAFSPLAEPGVRQRLIDEAARARVLCCDLRAAGVRTFDEIPL
ncbi:MAG: hypothetical protein ACF8NJ_09775, partial [Phycisphaerales bacterium JB038]